MNTIQRIAKNTGLLFLAQIVSYLMAFFYTIYAARYLGVEGFGILSFALAFSLIFSVLSDLGLSTLLVKDVSRDPSSLKKYMANLTLIKTIASLGTFLSIFIVIYLLNYPLQIIGVVLLIGSYIILTSFAQFFYSVFQAHEKLEFQALGSLINSILILSGVLLVIDLGGSVVSFGVVYAFAGIMVLIYSFLVCIWKFHFPRIEIDLDFWKKSFKTALPLSMVMVFSTIAFRVDSVLLSLLQGDTAVGFYNAPYKLIELTLFIPMIYSTAILPVMSKQYVSSQNSMGMIYSRSLKYFIILGIPIAAICTIFSEKIILLLYNSSYLPSVAALQILIWTVPVIFLTYILGTLLVSMDHQSLLLKITFLGMIFNIILNIILIPFYGFLGASLVTVLTELLALIILVYYASVLICKVSLVRYMIKPAFSTLIMSIIIFQLNLNLFISIILSFLIYLALLFLFKTFSEKDKYLLKELLHIRGLLGK